MMRYALYKQPFVRFIEPGVLSFDTVQSIVELLIDPSPKWRPKIKIS